MVGLDFLLYDYTVPKINIDVICFTDVMFIVFVRLQTIFFHCFSVFTSFNGFFMRILLCFFLFTFYKKSAIKNDPRMQLRSIFYKTVNKNKL